MVILIEEPHFADYHKLWLISGLTILPIISVAAAIAHSKNLKLYFLVAIIIAWLSATSLFIEFSSGWIMLIPTLLAMSNALRLQTLIAIGLVMSMPLLAELVVNEDFQGENIINLSTILLTLILVWNNHKEIIEKDNPQHVSDEQFVALINSMADGVIATDINRRITVYNGAALNLLNVNASLENKRVDNYLPLVNKNGKTVNMSTILKKMHGYFVSRDYRLIFPDSDAINLYIGVTSVKAGYGRKGSTGYVILLRDITKEKSLEEERDEFISVVSHELRTPAAVAEGSISNTLLLLKNKARRNQLSQALEESHKQALFLSSLINDLASLSRAERGVLKVDAEDIDINELIKTLAKDYRSEAETKGLKIKAIRNTDLKTLHTSRLYLHEILQNFVTNSIKYTKSGVITISASAIDDGVTFKVKDTGIGISKSDMQHVFDKFFRSEDYRTRESSGTGLGLYVTAKLTKLIDAKLEVESSLNNGSSFTISVPNYHAKNSHGGASS